MKRQRRNRSRSVRKLKQRMAKVKQRTVKARKRFVGRRARGWRKPSPARSKVHRSGMAAHLSGLARKAGFDAAGEMLHLYGSLNAARVQPFWHRWLEGAVSERISHDAYMQLMQAYVSGVAERSGHPADWVLLPDSRSLSCLLTAMNEESTIEPMLRQLLRLPVHEIIVVVNGSTDRTKQIAESVEGVKLLYFDEPLGHDVGRTISAKEAEGDLLLFMDADMNVPAEAYVPFFQVMREGADIALNHIAPFLSRFDRRDDVTVMKEFLNRLLDRGDLSVNSLTAVPHVMSRQAAEQIGLQKLAIPPLAQVLAAEAGLRIQQGGSVNVIKENRLRTSNTGSGNAVAELIIGDHLEAIDYLMKSSGPRLRFTDTMRKRG